MARICKRWTKKEDKILISQVKRHSNNLQAAFKATAIKLERSPKAVEFRWYHKLRHAGPIFMTISPKTNNINTKNTIHGKYNNTEKIKSSIWDKLLKFLKIC